MRQIIVAALALATVLALATNAPVHADQGPRPDGGPSDPADAGATWECLGNNDCGDQEYCNNIGKCRPMGPNYCASHDDCGADERCGSLHLCVPAYPDCIDDLDCRSDQYCEWEGSCVSVERDTWCWDDIDCGAGERCDFGSCQWVGAGYCYTDTDCFADEHCDLDGMCQLARYSQYRVDTARLADRGCAVAGHPAGTASGALPLLVAALALLRAGRRRRS